MRAQHDNSGDRVLRTKRRIPRPVGLRLASIRSEPQHRRRSTRRLDDETRQDAEPTRASRGPRSSDVLDGDSMNETANLGLVPLENLPRRARHKNERVRRSGTGGYVRS
jgi:hypothetical protein